MPGYDKLLFVRQDLPKDLLCVICQQVLREPVNCKTCLLFFCQSCTAIECTHRHKNPHEYIDANKFIKNKIEELVIRCKYSRFGCQFSSKVSDIEKHHDSCPLAKDHAQDDLTAKETQEIFKNTFKECQISQIDCNLGCKTSFKFLEKENKEETVEWLNGVIANFEKSQIGLKEENIGLKKELENQKNLQEKALSALNFELQSKLVIQDSLLKETEETREKYERIIKQLEDESAYKMKIFHENAEKRVDFYIEKTKEDYGLFQKAFAENVQGYFENVKQNVEVFNAQVENKTEQMLNKKEENGVKEGNKQQMTSPNKKVAVLG